MDSTKLKAFDDNEIKVKPLMISVFDNSWVKNILEIGENVGYQHFLLFLQCSQKPPSSELLKVGSVG